MSKKQFTLDSWLKDKSQKVVTRCGFPVRIVCTDVKRKDYPILALVERDDQEEYQSFTKDGRFSLYNPLHDNFDLFIETADEVSEDEKILEIIKHCIESRYLHTSTIKGISQKQCLAWLEKQSKQEKDILEDAILDGYTLDDDEDGLIAETIKYKNEKQGEKKPADSYCQENCKGFQETGKCFADGECKAKKEAKQKPVWKPTDEQMGCLSDAIEHYNSLGYPASKLKELLDDLKELKGEV